MMEVRRGSPMGKHSRVPHASDRVLMDVGPFLVKGVHPKEKPGDRNTTDAN